MRGGDARTGSLFSYVDLEAPVAQNHPLRAIRQLVNESLAALAIELSALYAPIGRPSICSARPRATKRRTSPTSIFFSTMIKGKLGLFELMDIKDYTASVLGRHADIMTRDCLHRTLRERIEAAALRVF